MTTSDAAKALLRKNGFVVTPFGRRIHITGFAGGRPGERSFAEMLDRYWSMTPEVAPELARRVCP